MNIYNDNTKNYIKRIVKHLLAIAFFYSGLFFIYRAINNIRGRRLTIVSYHRFTDRPVEKIDKSLPFLFVNGKNFEKHIKFYKKFYNITTFEEISKYGDKGRIPPNSMIITIDDGYEDNYKIAYPILKKYNVPATIYIATDYIENEKVPWWDEIYYLLSSLSAKKESNEVINNQELLEYINRFEKNAGPLFSELGKLDCQDNKRIMKMLDKVICNKEGMKQSNKFMSWEQINEISKNIQIGSHTCSHVSVVIGNHGQVLDELHRSKDKIENVLKRKVTSFAYPSGHHSSKIYNDIEKVGYQYAVTLDSGINNLRNRYSLKRYNIWEGAVRSVRGNFSCSMMANLISGGYR